MSIEQEKRLQDLQNKNQKVSENAMKINTQIEHAQETLEKLKEMALKKFGKTDLNELKALAELWNKENEEKLQEYESNINKLADEVQQKYTLIKQIQQN